MCQGHQNVQALARANYQDQRTNIQEEDWDYNVKFIN